MKIDSFFYFVGIVLAFFSGLIKLPFYFIFIAAAAMSIGFQVHQFPMLPSLLKQEGFVKVFLGALISIFSYAVFTAPTYYLAYFLAYLFS